VELNLKPVKKRGPPLLWSASFRPRDPIHWRANVVARRGWVGEKDPSGQMKRVRCSHSVEGSHQPGEIRLGEFLSPAEQAHDDKERSIGKKRTPEFRHRDRIRHSGDHNYGKDADREIGGPHYLLRHPAAGHG